jgi:membrane protein insertase Oxa1/YidC/SpoIIIJ
MKLLTKMVTLGQVTFRGWGVRFNIKDPNWTTVVALALILGAIVYVVKG